MQSAADLAAIAGAHAVAEYRDGVHEVPAWESVDAVLHGNQTGEGTPGVTECVYVDDDFSSQGECEVNVPVGATGVRVEVYETHETFFIQVVPGVDPEITTRASATARVELLFRAGMDSPFIVCGYGSRLADGSGELDILLDDDTVNPEAIAQTFRIVGDNTRRSLRRRRRRPRRRDVDGDASRSHRARGGAPRDRLRPPRDGAHSDAGIVRTTAPRSSSTAPTRSMARRHRRRRRRRPHRHRGGRPRHRPVQPRHRRRRPLRLGRAQPRPALPESTDPLSRRRRHRQRRRRPHQLPGGPASGPTRPDRDTDGGGLSDWAEVEAGTDPVDDPSDDEVDTDGDGLTTTRRSPPSQTTRPTATPPAAAAPTGPRSRTPWLPSRSRTRSTRATTTIDTDADGLDDWAEATPTGPTRSAGTPTAAAAPTGRKSTAARRRSTPATTTSTPTATG
jgi:hypothetical protein